MFPDDRGGDQAARSRLLRQREGAVLLDLDDREALVAESGNPLPVGEVPAGGLHPALDQVPGHDAAGDPLPVVGVPAVGVPDGGEGDAGVRDAPGDHDVRAVSQRPHDRLGAEIGVGRQDVGAPGPERIAGLQVVEPDPIVEKRVETAHQVVAVHHRHRQFDSAFRRRAEHGAGAASGIHPARVGDDRDPAFPDRAEERRDLAHEVAGVAGLGIAGALLLQDAHRDLGQEVRGHELGRLRPQHLGPERPRVVSPVAARVSDPDGSLHDAALPDPYIRKMPCPEPRTGAFAAAARLRASVRRVCRMSTIPSSQSRAVA